VSTKREREYERRRLEKWQERQARQRAARHRRNVIIGSIGAAAVVVVAVAVAVAQSGGSGADEPTTTPTPVPTVTTPVNSDLVPDPSLAEDRAWTGTIATTHGDLEIELDGAAAPQAVANFVTLAADGFFDGTSCHRLTTANIYVLQCGDPQGDGFGDPGYRWGPVENAPADDLYPAGTIAMARGSNDAWSMGSQFFLVYDDSTIGSDSAGGYTVFGKVTSGLDVLQAIADEGTADGSTDGPPASDVIIEGVETQ
jgi:peptidyl-prolyl cis-trans isomerase B (cyclophilin B)